MSIRYTITKFNPPGQIPESTYLIYKLAIILNPEYNIASTETFLEHFSGFLLIIGFGFPIGVLLIELFKNISILSTLGGISMILSLFSLIYLFLEGPSDATYLKYKKQYYDRMKYAIMNTSSYNEFVENFYH